jgi:hypothetical protein
MSSDGKLFSSASCSLMRSALLLLVLLAVSAVPARAEVSTIIPAPAFDTHEASNDNLSTAVLAGGCFWGVQAVFQHLKGVESAVSGYAGGEIGSAHYRDVSPLKSSSTLGLLPMVRFYKSISPWRMTRPNSTVKDLMSARNTVLQSSMQMNHSGRLPRDTLLNSTRFAPLGSAS